MSEIAKPKCPDCGVQGIENIVSDPSVEESKGGDPWFNVAYCKECGHVYGVFAKVVNHPTVLPPPMPKMPKMF